jgi:hypothetical protein
MREYYTLTTLPVLTDWYQGNSRTSWFSAAPSSGRECSAAKSGFMTKFRRSASPTTLRKCKPRSESGFGVTNELDKVFFMQSLPRGVEPYRGNLVGVLDPEPLPLGLLRAAELRGTTRVGSAQCLPVRRWPTRSRRRHFMCTSARNGHEQQAGSRTRGAHPQSARRARRTSASCRSSACRSAQQSSGLIGSAPMRVAFRRLLAVLLVAAGLFGGTGITAPTAGALVGSDRDLTGYRQGGLLEGPQLGYRGRTGGRGPVQSPRLPGSDELHQRMWRGRPSIQHLLGMGPGPQQHRRAEQGTNLMRSIRRRLPGRRLDM